MGKNKMMDWERDVEKFLNKHNGVPYGDFCYQEVTPGVRYYCKHLYDCCTCDLTHKNDIFDFIKTCGINKGVSNGTSDTVLY